MPDANTTPRLKHGHTRVHTLDGSCYTLPVDAHDDIRARWMLGVAFWTGASFYGAPLTIKFARVEGVQLMTAAAWDAGEAAERADEAEARADVKPWESD